MINKYKALNRFALISIVFLIVFSNVLSVQANIGDGGGEKPSSANWGYWWNTSGDPWEPGMNGTPAWHDFYNKQMRAGYDDSSLKTAINKAGGRTGGFQNPDGTYQTLVESCQKSQHIWWYGANPVGSSYGKEYWFTEGNNTNSVGPGWEKMAGETYEYWVKYKAHPKSRWDNKNIVLVCSGAYSQETTPKLFLQAASGTFMYDGTPKTVSGRDYEKSNTLQLKPEHEILEEAIATETNPGSYDVPWIKVHVFNKNNGIEVTDKYTIEKKKGELIIEEEDEPKEEEEPQDDWRCVDHQSDSATAFTFNTTTGSYGFTPYGAPGLNGTYEERETSAGQHANGGRSLPKRKASLSAWESWKSTFESGSDEITPDLDLEAAGVSDVLSQYGGVYNIMRSLTKDTYSVTHCQPQTREWIRIPASGWVSGTPATYNEDGSLKSSGSSGYYRYPAYWTWSEWEDDGGRIVWDSSGPSGQNYKYNYQILSVNCNKDGFNDILSSTGGTRWTPSGNHAGSVLKTPEQVGAGPGQLGRSGTTTGSDAFYNDGDSCKEVYKCTVDILPGASNDANNNRTAEPFFTEEADGEHGEPFDKNNLVFFRDNVDRQVRASVWYPKATGVSDLSSYPGEKAYETLASIYGGTPELELTTIAPCESSNIDNCDYNKYMNYWEESWNTHYNRFIMKSQWASDKGKPYEMGINWRYEGSGYNIVPSVADGYDIKSMTSPYDYDFDIYCEFKNESGDYQANIPDTPFAWGYTSPTWDPSHAIRTLFTRSVSDTQK